MNCVFPPYEITSSDFSGNDFVDTEKFSRIAVIVPCGSTVSLPCSNALVVHVADDCPEGCNIIWYECKTYGRTYTIIPNPCGVTITSFDGGLLNVNGCDTSQYGSSFFCYGKVYSSAGEFEGSFESVSFEFDGHTFNVSGVLGDCGEIYSCLECEPTFEIESFSAVPVPPDVANSPGDSSSVIDDTGVETQIIPSEDLTIWSNVPSGADTGREVACNDEVSVNSWIGGTDLPICGSNDHPSVVTLPSGHTIVAYENRILEEGQEGITQIAISILSSSVAQNIRYHRKLSRGTLLNNLSETNGVGSFIIYDELFIDIDSLNVPSGADLGLKIGFLSGVLAGQIFTVSTTSRDSSQRTFNFNINSNVDFPDKNNIYDTEWFLISPSSGDANLPDSSDIISTVTIPNHTFEGSVVPLSSPSITAADNNVMSGSEMNIYISYQAFENNEWRVYLREIVLGSSAEIGPKYLAPYLFEDPYEDPYGGVTISYNPEDVWSIQTGDNSFATRVLYHMEKQFIIAGSEELQGSGQGEIDFVFIIDHSGSMANRILKVRNAVPGLSQSLLDRGISARFGFVVYARGVGSSPSPSRTNTCTSTVGNTPYTYDMFNGLQSGCGNPEISGGFTTESSALQLSLDCWGVDSGYANHWSAINFAILDSEFDWNPNSNKYIFMITDTNDEVNLVSCGSYFNDRNLAIQNLLDNDITFLGAFCQSGDFGCSLSSPLFDVPAITGWTGGDFSVNSSDYGEIFTTVAENIFISARTTKRRVIERSNDVVLNNPAYLKPAEIIVTYDGDLSDRWSFNKSDFKFVSSSLPIDGILNKGIDNFPFSLSPLGVYGINSVHIQGKSSRWTTFDGNEPLSVDYPNVGFRKSSVNNPILISANATQPKVLVNNSNQVMVVYESHTDGNSNIEIKGTGDFHKNSITGPKGNRVSRFVEIGDFVYTHNITLLGEGLNQLCDFVIDRSDITHVVWQSNRNGYWEIYYANSFNLFDPVRVTDYKSRSARPSIDVDDNGSIFIVYQDDRFGPFEVMLALKDEDRVVPLLEQDAYLASLRNDYTHYTNILPVTLDNPSTVPNNLWASKVATDPGNDYENYIYLLNRFTGSTSSGFNTDPVEINYIAFSGDVMYGINTSGDLYRLGSIQSGITVIFNLEFIGRIPINIGIFLESVLDISFDQFGRAWILVYAKNSISSVKFLELMYVSLSDASLISRGIFYSGAITGIEGSLSIDSNNIFYVTSTRGDRILSSSLYPIISGVSSTFSFNDVNVVGLEFMSMSFDQDGILYGIDSLNDLYIIDKFSGAADLQTSLNSEIAGNESPVGSASGVAFWNTGTSSYGVSDFFHILIEFYDNIEFEGDVFLAIDSRTNLEAFINDEVVDEYGTLSQMSAAGVYVELDSLSTVFFDATHFSPGFLRLSQPYNFEPNQTYFPKVYSIGSSGNIRLSEVAQNNSFSCSKCSRFGNNNFNSSGCSYSFVVSHINPSTRYFNFQVDFYADSGKQHIIRRFIASPGHEDLQYFEVDNKPATDEWGILGLPVESNSKRFVQIYPQLDPQAGFLCGVNYTVQVNQCSDNEKLCSNFGIIETTQWNSVSVEGESVSTSIDNNDMLGVSMATFNDNLAVAWRADDNTLRYSVYNGDTWSVEVIDDDCSHLDLVIANNQPAIVYTKHSGSNDRKLTRWFNGSSWAEVPNMSRLVNGSFMGPPSISEINGNLVDVVVFIGGFLTTQTSDGVNSILEISSGRFCDTSNVNGLVYVLYVTLSGDLTYRTFDGLSWSLHDPIDTDVVMGKPSIIEINGQPAISYLKIVGSKARLIYRRFNGSLWQNSDTNTGINDFNKHVSMTVVNNNPVISYSISSENGSDIRSTRLISGVFVDVLVDSVDISDPALDSSVFNGRAALVVSANPFSVYLFNQNPESSIDKLSPGFFCECSSKIFKNRVTHLSEISRWKSSANGFADTRVTDSYQNSVLPVVKSKKSGVAIILWEDHNSTEICPNPPCIRASTFRNLIQDQLRGSGTQSWFDFDFGIQGWRPDMVLDIYGRTNIVYGRLKPPSSDSGFFGNQISPDELPSSETFMKVCDFSPEEIGVQPQGNCDVSSLESNITFDPFVSSGIVKKILIKDEFVNYYTYNASGSLTPIVSVCNISLHVHGTPEVVAIRLRNENQAVFGPWCPWSPEISDFVMEKEHKISGGTGVKEICIQAMTYSGITTEFCIPVVADYESIIFDTKFYVDSVDPAEFENFTIDNADLVSLPSSDGILVANLSPKQDNPVRSESTVLVEIFPDKDPVDENINFDVIQQGSDDRFGLVAYRGENNGRLVYRGHFSVKKEDKVFNIDGLARISPSFPNACDDGETMSSATYLKDKFNQVGDIVEVENNSLDSLSEFRQDVSGRVGVSVDIRTTEDPYFIFGDPNYSTKIATVEKPGLPIN